ncbi:MAG: glycogen synthase [Heliobacteriaceae bacterium]|jgi:starch synthase|nr:glycogen synthase [Heliobacteriaceae bacterium]
MKILFASAETAPFSKAGGLADVAGSLPKYLEKPETEIAVFTPLHGSIDADKYGIKELENSELWLTFGGRGHKFRLFMCKLPDTDINVFFVHNDWYYTAFKEIYPKWLDTAYEHERYIAFSLAVLEYAKLLNFRADIIHANDWHTAMIPVYLKSNYRLDEFWQNTKTVFEIHNLAYQGVWFEDVLDFANMHKDIVYNEHGVEHYGKVNWMKGAINYSDKVVTVSPSYAREILTGEYGEGMDYTLRMNQHKLTGILNGIDYDVFNPAKDKTLAANYTAKTLGKKEKNKQKLCEIFGLKYNPERPVYTMVSRLVSQKGLDLIRAAQNDLMNADADFVFLGTGDKDYENLLIWLSNNSANIRALIGYKADLANIIYAGADFFLMPSAFEPCGLSQMIAMRYGTLPVVRETGGLADSVIGYPLDNSTGFKFWGYDAGAMLGAIRTAAEVYKDKYTLNAMRGSAMKADFSWKKSARKYMELYRELVE